MAARADAARWAREGSGHVGSGVADGALCWWSLGRLGAVGGVQWPSGESGSE